MSTHLTTIILFMMNMLTFSMNTLDFCLQKKHHSFQIYQYGPGSSLSLPSCLVLQTMCYHSCFQVLDLVRDFEYQVREENQEVTGLKSNKIIWFKVKMLVFAITESKHFIHFNRLFLFNHFFFHFFNKF